MPVTAACRKTPGSRGNTVVNNILLIYNPCLIVLLNAFSLLYPEKLVTLAKVQSATGGDTFTEYSSSFQGFAA